MGSEDKKYGARGEVHRLHPNYWRQINASGGRIQSQAPALPSIGEIHRDGSIKAKNELLAQFVGVSATIAGDVVA
jgi:hypothetical protein